MKILWLSHDSNMSGANICLDEFLEIMHGEKVENHLIIPRDGKMKESALNKTSAIHFVKFYSWNWPINSTPPISLRIKRLLRNRKAVYDIEKLIRLIKPDYVVSNTVVTPVAALAAKRTGTKHIWIIHEFGEEDHGYTIGGGFKNAARKINDLSSEVVFVSKAVEQKYMPFVSLEKRQIVHNAFLGETASAVHKIAEGKLRLIMLGQIAPSKNQLDAFKAIKYCMQSGLDVTLDVFGKADEDEYKKELDEFIRSENLHDRISFRGPTNNPLDILIQYDALLMCSRMEAFGRVTVEALKCGVPVIAANTGGTNEIVKDNIDGYLYQSGNATNLAEKIQLFARRRDIFLPLEIASRANLAFNEENTRKQLINVFSR